MVRNRVRSVAIGFDRVLSLAIGFYHWRSLEIFGDCFSLFANILDRSRSFWIVDGRFGSLAIVFDGW